jgi:hypothetical protein
MVSFPEHAKEGSEDTLLYLTCVRIRGLSDQSEALQKYRSQPRPNLTEMPEPQYFVGSASLHYETSGWVAHKMTGVK